MKKADNKQGLHTIVYYVVFVFWYLISLLPLQVLYRLSDLLYLILYYMVRYRRPVVRKNLVESFPDKDLKEIIHIEKKFYAFFCDYIYESLKLFTMSRKQMERRMQFEGFDLIEEAFKKGRSCSLYLGHYCNWEWISSIPIHLNGEAVCGQIYHPLENKDFDRLFLRMRSRFKAISIGMDDTFRTIMEWKKEGRNSIVGYISDQVPGYNNIHYFADFLHHDTPVFTGAERISRIVDAVVFYADITRVKRGHYFCKFIKITDHPQETPKFAITAAYFKLLEATIQRAPQYWLWSHKRWKRTRQEFEKMYSKEEQQKRLSRL